jgi:hypothetical protein
VFLPELSTSEFTKASTIDRDRGSQPRESPIIDQRRGAARTHKIWGQFEIPLLTLRHPDGPRGFIKETPQRAEGSPQQQLCALGDPSLRLNFGFARDDPSNRYSHVEIETDPIPKIDVNRSMGCARVGGGNISVVKARVSNDQPSVKLSLQKIFPKSFWNLFCFSSCLYLSEFLDLLKAFFVFRKVHS